MSRSKRISKIAQACLLASTTLAQSHAAQVELPVSANMDIYRAGGYNDGTDGIAPAVFSFSAGLGRTLLFQSVSGSWTCSTAIAVFTADGITGGLCDGRKVANPEGPFSGYHSTDFAGAMVGMFLEDTLPTEAPPSLRFYLSDAADGGVSTAFQTLRPQIGQVFFIGDGLTGTGIGQIQAFDVPGTATHLYLGFLDDCDRTSTTPGCYSDNAGTLTAVFRLESSVLDWVEPQLTTSTPSTRCCPAMAYDAATKSMLEFGGGNGGIYPPVRYGDTWEFRDGWYQLFPASSPSPRQGAEMAYDPTTETVVLFGGGSGDGPPYNDTWLWDGINWTEQFPPVSPPSSESDSQEMVFDKATGNVVLWASSLGTTWVWDGLAKMWTQQFPAASPPPSNATMAYDDAHGNIVLFGGTDSEGYLNQTWVWDGLTWTRQFPAISPSPRSLCAMAYDANLTRVVLFGGTQGPPSALSDTWVWDGSTWTQIQPHKSPEGRWAAGLVYDPLDSGLVLFGGELVGDPFANDTWLFQAVSLP